MSAQVIPMPGRPVVNITDRDLETITGEALAALVAANEPPETFVAHGGLARIVHTRQGPSIEPLSLAALRGRLARVAAWKTTRSRGEVVREIPCWPPPDVVSDLASLPGWPSLPHLAGIVHTPVLGEDAEIHAGPGYDADVELWIDSVDDLQLPALTHARLEWARDLLLAELLGDFPFVDQADRANAMAMLLLPFLRPAIAGVTPLHLVEAPTEGTGKGLLAQVVTSIALGRQPGIVTMGRDSDEMRKRITSWLVSGRPVIVMDNLVGLLDSPDLAAALTIPEWGDRQLGSLRDLRVPVRATWVATGNNLSLSGEMARRTLRIRLDAGVETPYERTEFRHPNLLAWARRNRSLLVEAALTLVQAWLAEDRPPGPATMGSYEEWAAVVGGVLEVAGIPGLNANAAELRASAVNEDAAWRELAELWFAKHGENPIKAGELWQLAADIDGLGVTGNTELAQKGSFGKRLASKRDRRVGPWQIRNVGNLHRAALWRLVVADSGVVDGCEGRAADLHRPSHVQPELAAGKTSPPSQPSLEPVEKGEGCEGRVFENGQPSHAKPAGQDTQR